MVPPDAVAGTVTQVPAASSFGMSCSAKRAGKNAPKNGTCLSSQRRGKNWDFKMIREQNLPVPLKAEKELGF